LKIDAFAALPGITEELVTLLSRIGPFGQANPNIRVQISHVVNLKPGIVGESHVKTLFIDPLSNAKLSGISFRSVGTKLGDALLSTRGKTLNVVGQLSMKEYNGAPSISFMVEDIAQC
jgi:single-stranded-DNA-specific exonuclease